MRRMSLQRALLLSLALSVALSGVALAQGSGQTDRRTIFDYKTELGLTDEQEVKIRRILADLNRELRLARAKLTILQYDLDDLMEKEGDLQAIKKNLTEQAEMRARARFEDIAATRRINSLLSKKQLTKWRALQAAARATQELKAERQ